MGIEMTVATDIAADDERSYLNAIARRNTTWAYFEAARELCEAAERTGVDRAPYIGNYNDAQRDYEHAERNLVRARVWYRDELMRTRMAGR